MTTTNQQINKALALAIGYLPEHVREYNGYVFVLRHYSPSENRNTEPVFLWCHFDHTDWRTMGPIAEKFDAFPKKADFFGSWISQVGESKVARANPNPATASALAVIKAKGVPL